VACCPRIESTDARDEQIPNYRIEKPPKNIDR